MIHGNMPMREKTGSQMVPEVRSHGASELPPAERTEPITVLDVLRDIASAKLVTPHWVDYRTLSKWDGEWKILSVVQRTGEAIPRPRTSFRFLGAGAGSLCFTFLCFTLIRFTIAQFAALALHQGP